MLLLLAAEDDGVALGHQATVMSAITIAVTAPLCFRSTAPTDTSAALLPETIASLLFYCHRGLKRNTSNTYTTKMLSIYFLQ